MNGIDFGKVKLVSLDIVGFKTLQKGIVSWKYQPLGLFGVIHVRDFSECSTLYQAFQFAFGHETDARNAEVIVTFQRSIPNGIQTMDFKHSKTVSSNRTKSTFGIRIDGEDEAFQQVDRKIYLERLAELKVFAATQAFLFGGCFKNTLATDQIDLRSFLEAYLMEKPHRVNDYDEIDLKFEGFAGQMNLLKKKKRFLNTIKKLYEEKVNARNEKSNEICERDLHLLQLFYQHKHEACLEDDIERLQNCIGTVLHRQDDIDQLIKQLKEWMSEMVKNGLLEHNFIAIETSEKSWNLLIEKRCEAKENQIDSMEEDVSILTLATTVAFDQFNEDRPQFDHDNMDLCLKLEDVQSEVNFEKIVGNLKSWREEEYTIEKKMADFDRLDESLFDPTDKNAFEKLKQSEMFEREFHALEAIVHSKIDVHENILRCPKDSYCELKTRIPESKILIRKALKEENALPGRLLLSICSPADLLVTNLECAISYEQDDEPKDFDVIQSTLALMSGLVCIEKYNDLEFREVLNLIKEKEFLVPTIGNNDENIASEELLKLERVMEETEREIAMKCSSVFNYVLNELGLRACDTNSIITAVNSCKRYQGVIGTNDQEINDVLDELKEKSVELEQYKLKLENWEHLEQIPGNRMSLQGLWKKGNDIFNLALKFVDNAHLQSVLLINEAMIKGKTFAIQYLTEQVLGKDWQLPFDPQEEKSPMAYLKCVSARNKLEFDKEMMSEIWEIVSFQIMAIEREINLPAYDGGIVYHDNQELKRMILANNKHIKKITLDLVAEKRKFAARVDAFEERFCELCDHFEQFHSLPNMSLQLHYSGSALSSPILISVFDPKLDISYGQATTLNHHAAALLLKLIINTVIESPVLIFDSLDYIIEPCLISPILELLQKMANDLGIQVIFLLINPQKDLYATSTHHMWNNNTEVEQISDTTELVFVPNRE